MIIGNIKGALHNVVCEFVVNHLGETILRVSDLDTDYSVQDHAFAAFGGELKTFLNDVRTELMQAVWYNIVNNLIDYKALFVESAPLYDMRNYVVSEFMHCQFGDHAHDLFSNKLNLISREPLHNALDNAAPILILTKLAEDHLDLLHRISHLYSTHR